MSGLESVIRPFVGADVTPKAFVPPGTAGTPNVHVVVGMKGGTKTFSFSGSQSAGFAMGNAHKETAPKSESLQVKLSEATDNG